LKSPIRVLYVHHVADGLGGSTRSMVFAIKSFPSGAIIPCVACPSGRVQNYLKDEGLQTRHLKGVSLLMSTYSVPLTGFRKLDVLRAGWNLQYSGQLRAAMRSFQPDVVHLNERGMLAAAVVARRMGVPVVMHARTTGDSSVRWVQKLSDRIINENVDTLIAIDESVANSLPGIHRKVVVYNPLEPLDRQGTAPRLPGDVTRVTYVGGLLPLKGIWDVVHAALVLKKRGRSNIIFQIAGENARPASFHKSLKGVVATSLGFSPDIETPLRAFIAKHDLSDMVELLGFVKDVATLVAEKTDILLFPSHCNATGRGVFEAGIYGVPSIVALNDRIEDIVENGVTGLICPIKDPEALAQSIENLADNPNLRRKMGIAARNKYVRQFDPEKAAQAILEVYRDVLSRRESSVPIGNVYSLK
jgi:glycosyltransferase involved in cell wall biosynthesis